MSAASPSTLAPTPTRPAGDVPRTIRLRDDDNVAIVVNAFGLPAGTVFPDGLTLTEFVPQGHKVALADIPSRKTLSP